MTVTREIMNREPVTVEMDTTLERIRGLFQKAHTHHVVVVRGREPVGIISDRDVLKTVSPFVGKLSERPQDLVTLNRLAHQVMSRDLITVTGETPIEDAINLLLQHNISALPILTPKGKLMGTISWRNILRHIANTATAQADDDATPPASAAA